VRTPTLDPVWRIETSDALSALAGAPEAFFHACITSPPYWGGIRDYGVQETDWPAVVFTPVPGLPPVEIEPWRGCLGHEASVWAYVGHLVDVFRGVARSLRQDGTLWLNLGDTYASGGRGGGPAVEAQLLRATGNPLAGAIRNVSRRWLDPETGGMRKWRRAPDGHKHKDLVGIPWMVAQALKADGWMLRSEIIWHKLNGWPESVEDRPTRAHEHIFLFTLSDGPVYWTHPDIRGVRGRLPHPDRRWIHRETRAESLEMPPPAWRWINRETGEVLQEEPTGAGWKRVNAWRRVNLWEANDYYFDLDALREPHAPESLRRVQYGRNAGHKWGEGPDSLDGKWKGWGSGYSPLARTPERSLHPGGRAIRTVWSVANRGFAGPHFATYPDEIPRRCMALATSPAGCCPACGAPLTRVTRVDYVPSPGHGSGSVVGRRDPTWEHSRDGSLMPRLDKSVTTLGWRPSCPCAEAETPVACRVVDPFVGSGTTVRVGQSDGRSVFGIELSNVYAEMGREDLRSVAPLFVPLRELAGWEGW
jgi:DNA modification methylase